MLYQNPKVLLGMKKIKFRKGKYNGFGGGIEKNETIEEAAIRETFEESGIIVKNPELKGRIRFHFYNREQDHLIHFFKAEEFYGEPRETSEMIPGWFNKNEIPYDKMREDDKYWLPLLLEDKCFTGRMVFDERNNLYKVKLKILEEL